jgi:hypothetical protein
VIILYACVLLVAVHALLPRSDLRRLAATRIRHTWLIWSALGLQVLIMSVVPNVDQGLSAALHVGTYALAGAFAVLNLAQGPGTWVIGAGGGLNLAAIVANAGTMPASPTAVAASGWEAAEGRFANSAVLPSPRLEALGDVFATPAWFPVQSVFSVGDVLIVVGVGVFLHLRCRRPRPALATSGDVVRESAGGQLG